MPSDQYIQAAPASSGAPYENEPWDERTSPDESEYVDEAERRAIEGLIADNAIEEFTAVLPALREVVGENVEVFDPWAGAHGEGGPGVELAEATRYPTVAFCLDPAGGTRLYDFTSDGLKELTGLQARERLGLSHDSFEQARAIVGQGLAKVAARQELTDWPMPQERPPVSGPVPDWVVAAVEKDRAACLRNLPDRMHPAQVEQIRDESWRAYLAGSDRVSLPEEFSMPALKEDLRDMVASRRDELPPGWTELDTDAVIERFTADLDTAMGAAVPEELRRDFHVTRIQEDLCIVGWARGDESRESSQQRWQNLLGRDEVRLSNLHQTAHSVDAMSLLHQQAETVRTRPPSPAREHRLIQAVPEAAGVDAGAHARLQAQRNANPEAASPATAPAR